MKQLRIEVPGNPWRGRINVRTGGRWSKARRDARAYQDEVALWCATACRVQGGGFSEGYVEVWITLVVPDRRRRDLDGPIKALLDGVTQGGGWGDDSQVEQLHVRRVVRKGDTRAILVVRGLTLSDLTC